MRFLDTNKEIAPCIVSKARYELGLKSKKPNNRKFCSKNYWQRTIETLASHHKTKPEKIESAINNYKIIFQ